MYSSITEKYGLCCDCADGIEKPIIAGRCKYVHYKKHQAEVQLKKQQEKNKLRSLINTPKNKEIARKIIGATDSDMTIYYVKRMGEVEAVCDNCGVRADWIKQPQYYKLWKAAQAHILEKRHFISIMTHPLNFLTMFAAYSGVCGCHTYYDSNWLNASKMNIWTTVIERFKILYPLIKPNEHKFIPDILLNTL